MAFLSLSLFATYHFFFCSCVCRPGYSGAHCRLRQNTCLASQSSELCGSHGTCLPDKNAAGFVCICDQGWTWADTNATSASPSPCSRDFDECAPAINPCFDVCINLPGSFRCGACPPGYTGWLRRRQENSRQENSS